MILLLSTWIGLVYYVVCTLIIYVIGTSPGYGIIEVSILIGYWCLGKMGEVWWVYLIGYITALSIIHYTPNNIMYLTCLGTIPQIVLLINHPLRLKWYYKLLIK